MLKYCKKVLKSHDNSFIRKMYNILEDDVNNVFSYSKKKLGLSNKYMLNQIGISNIWLQQDIKNINIHEMKVRILDTKIQSWYSNINNSNGLSSNSHFKHNFQCEKYLSVINKDTIRITLTKFRPSAHNLEIEKGRHEIIENVETVH
jgi:hypothetical protein